MEWLFIINDELSTELFPTLLETKGEEIDKIDNDLALRLNNFS